jgi:hypothetical protein
MIVCPFILFILAIVLSVLLRFRDSDYLFGILDLGILITYLVSSNYSFIIEKGPTFALALTLMYCHYYRVLVY